MSAEEDKVIARGYFEAFANEVLARMDERAAPDSVRHDPGLPSEARGPEGVRHLDSPCFLRLSRTGASASRTRPPKGTRRWRA